MKKEPHTEIDPTLIEEALESVEKVEKDKPADDLQDRLLRVTADFDNFRKRVQKEKAEFVRYAHEDLVKTLLPVLDNFERALDHMKDAPDVATIRQGVELIFSQLTTSLEKYGVRSESAAGKPFDPLYHEAISHISSAEHAPNTVIEEHQKAYFLHDRLLRPAMVVVSKDPEDAVSDLTND